MRVGEWVAVSEDGIRFSSFESDKCSWRTKADVIKDIGDACLDARNTPKVRRLRSGVYLYTPKHVDTGRDGDTYTLYRLDADNIEHFKELAAECAEYE